MPEREPLRSGDPERLGDYRLSGRLGEGGQGVVYLATSSSGTQLAIKLLHTWLVPDVGARARLLREVEAASRIPSFCTAKVVGLGLLEDGRPYVVSEYVDGDSLQTVVERDGPLSEGALSRLAVATATALAATHRAGVVHRDFKPHNVILGADGARVIDFGIAQALESATKATSGPIGTPSYMAPEQLREERTGPAADMFSWGVAMTYAATGRPAFGDAKFSAINRILHEDPDLNGVPDGLRELIARCLDKDPHRRPSAREVWEELLAADPGSHVHLLGQMERPPPVSPTVDRPADLVGATRPAGRPPRRTQYLIAGLAIIVVAGVSVAAVAFGMLRRGAGTPGPGPPPLTVGSANFPESALLAEIYAQVLESKGFHVTRRFNIGNRESYYAQVASGAVGVIPEYNGALASHIGAVQVGAPGPTTTEEINALLRGRLPPALEILRSAKAEDKDSVTVTQATARQYGLKSISDLAGVAQDLVLGGSPEFETRHQGVIGLRATYHVSFKDYQPFRLDDRATMISLLRNGTIQAANLFTTDPAIQQYKFVVLADPQQLFLAQNVTPLVYRSAVNDTAREALNAVSAKLATPDLLEMNTRVSLGQEDPAIVAKEWLAGAGLVS